MNLPLFGQPAQKKDYAIIKDNRIIKSTDPVFEVINLEGQSSKARPNFDLLLECMLKNNETHIVSLMLL
jgi:hypothetical protein